MGLILCASGYIEEGITILKQAEIIFNKNFKENYNLISFYINMGYALELHKEYDKALKYLIKAYSLVLKNKKTYSLYMYQISPIEKLPPTIEAGDLSYYRQALNLTEKIFGKEHPRIARYHYLLGLVLENIGDIINAKQHYNEALNIHSRQQFKDKILIKGNQRNIELIQKCLEKLRLSRN
jgi:tetratricopeptide (TPR) repeat protein